MTRDDYGSGSVYQRGDGRWVGALMAGWTEQGTRRRITVTSKGCPDGCPPKCAHRAQIKRKLRDKRRALEDGEVSVSARTTVKQWADIWLPIAETKRKPGAYNADRSAITRWIVPTIGHKRLERLSPADVRAVAEAQRAAGRSSSTAHRTHSTLTVLLKAAVEEGHTIPQRVFLVDAPPLAANDRTDMSVDEAVLILEQAADLPHGSRYVAALLQGIRQAESLGLTWPQVDLDTGTLTIAWQLKPLPYRIPRDRTSGFRVPDGFEARQLKGALHLVRPKSKAGWRVIPLVPWMRTALTAWREIAPASPHGLVWPNLNGDPITSKVDDKEWYALQTAAGVSHPEGRFYGIHEARHTTATLLMEADVDPSVITQILGHSSIVTSRGYMHAKTTHARAALDKVATRLQLDG